jgi:lipid-binding SYLF domain-containing protein
MKHTRILAAAFLSAILGATSGLGSKKADLQVEVTVETFREASQTAEFFENAYGYAVFPTIGKGGIGIGGAHGTGRVYKQGEYVGDTSITQVTIGFQLGGQAYSQIIFFEDERAFNEFTSGEFEFGAQASAVAITAGAQASAGSAGTSASASTSSDSTHTREKYYRGMAVFTYAKGGLMYEASLGGQKFKYKPKK